MIKDLIIKLMKKAHEEVADEEWKELLTSPTR